MAVSQVGKQIDNNLRVFLGILEAATEEENDGKVLYVRRGEAAFEDGEMLFDITPLTQEG